MLSMPGIQGVASGRTVSAGTMVVFAAGFALYQLTSLLLGPASSRQLDLSLTIPAVEVQDLWETLSPNVRLVVGTRATAAAPASGAAPIAGPSRASSTPALRPSSHALPAVIPKPQPTAIAKPEPAVVPSPEPDANDSNHHDNP